jgi:hypothetical protein
MVDRFARRCPTAADNHEQATGKAAGFADYPRATKTPAGDKNAPAATARRPRPIACIADGCLCSFASDEAYEAGIPREQLPIGCAEL